jgi:glutamate--cysteine ligase
MHAKVQALLKVKHYLKDNLIGLEKESLRVLENGTISYTSHPEKLGKALINSAITTDFSENLLEIITPPLSGAENVLDYLKNIEYFVNQFLDDSETLWHQSMPCLLPEDDKKIPLAQYGDSNMGKMKTVYRNGLSLRYGRNMQTIAGIHFNYSFSDNFLKAIFEGQKELKNYQNFVDETYMDLSRNVLRYGWILTYLFGASPVVSKTFLNNYHEHNLQELNKYDLYEADATSLRMGDIGYQNTQECELGVKVSYNSLREYVESLEIAMNKNCPVYSKKGLKEGDEYKQLSTNILQIENEYYNNIRPKQLTNTMQTPSDALNKKGILYIELRTLDINPLLKNGIDKEQILFLEVFLLFCLLTPSPKLSLEQQLEINKNDTKVAHSGRDKALKLSIDNEEILLFDFAKNIFDKMKAVLPLMSDAHIEAFNNIAKRIDDSSLLPSKQILDKITKQGFIDCNLALSSQHKEIFLTTTNDKDIQQELADICKKSFEKQLNIEAADKLDFATYLQQYFNKGEKK